MSVLRHPTPLKTESLTDLELSKTARLAGTEGVCSGASCFLTRVLESKFKSKLATGPFFKAGESGCPQSHLYSRHSLGGGVS